MVGHERPVRDSFEGDNVMLKVINVGNVPVMGISVPSNRKGTDCIFMVLTAVVIGALLEGFIKCRSISNNFPIKEKLLGHCTNIACGSFTSLQLWQKGLLLRDGLCHFGFTDGGILDPSSEWGKKAT